MPRHKLEVIKLLIIATKPVETVKMFWGRSQILAVRVLLMGNIRAHLNTELFRTFLLIEQSLRQF